MPLNNKPAFYFPLANGRYEVAAGLHRLEQDFGNGLADHQIFQFDDTFHMYRENKLACRRECLSKYYVEKGFTAEAKMAVISYLVAQLCREHPDKFVQYQEKDQIRLNCLLTGEQLSFADGYRLAKITGLESDVPYASALDALANQIQEDLSIVQLDQSDNNYITALHLCSPNHWAASDKIGQSFIEAHQPVPHMTKLNQQAHKLFTAILEKGPFVRFAWGLSADQKLNHHPQLRPGLATQVSHRKHFDLRNPELWLRVERQTLIGLKEVNAVLFTIRTYLYDIRQLKQASNKLDLISSAIRTMSDNSLRYKNLQQSKKDILNWLQATKHNPVR